MLLLLLLLLLRTCRESERGSYVSNRLVNRLDMTASFCVYHTDEAVYFRLFYRGVALDCPGTRMIRAL